jgi:hypothetical protein
MCVLFAMFFVIIFIATVYFVLYLFNYLLFSWFHCIIMSCHYTAILIMILCYLSRNDYCNLNICIWMWRCTGLNSPAKPQ